MLKSGINAKIDEKQTKTVMRNYAEHLDEKSKIRIPRQLEKKEWYLIVYERISPLCFLKIKKAEKEV